ncbi:MAG: YcxB family protein, partial [Acetatifactor sp.]|nr:YcxB family protein [Acetatifactor sp.]
MQKYSFKLTKKEVRELGLREIWERLLLHRAKGLLLLALLALECVFTLWTIMLATAILLLPLFAALTMLKIVLMKKQLCGRTRTIKVENGMLKQNLEGELQSEIPCSSITEVRITRHLLMLGLHQASKVIAWYPIPLRVFADEQERDRFVETIRNPQAAGETGTLSAEDDGASEENSEQEYFSVSFQVGEEEWIRTMAAATEIIQSGTLGEQTKRSVWIALAGIVFSCGYPWFISDNTGIMYILSFLGTIIFLVLLQNMLVKPEKRIRAQIRRGTVQNNACGVWTTFITEMGIRQSISGKKSILMPWEGLFCMVETDTELFFYQKDKRHFSVLAKKGIESREQIETLKELCREKHVEVLVGKRKKYM